MASTVKTLYLFAYNFASAVAWTTVLGRVVAVIAYRGYPLVRLSVDNFARITQSFALLEIVHAILGIVPAGLVATVLQVSSRLLLMWVITYLFPEVTASPVYSSMLAAWSLAEIIRYSYFALKQAGAEPPYWLHWLRYSAFIVLYPIGIGSELWEVWLAASGPAKRAFPPWVATVGLASIYVTYLFGSPLLYMHMLKQRRKQLSTYRYSAEGTEDKKQS